MSNVAKQFGRNELTRLGRQIQRVRNLASLTRSELAAASGLSVSSVRGIEDGRSSPSLATVVAITNALGITIDELVSAARRAVVVVHTPAHDRYAEGPRADLTRELPEPQMRAQTIRLSSDSVLVLPEPAQPSFCFVLEGSVAVALGSGTTTRLHRGDCFHAAPGVVRDMTCGGSEPVRLLWITSPARTGANQQARSLEHKYAGGS